MSKLNKKILKIQYQRGGTLIFFCPVLPSTKGGKPGCNTYSKYKFGRNLTMNYKFSQ
jgi:hypothetical protein